MLSLPSSLLSTLWNFFARNRSVKFEVSLLDWRNLKVKQIYLDATFKDFYLQIKSHTSPWYCILSFLYIQQPNSREVVFPSFSSEMKRTYTERYYLTWLLTSLGLHIIFVRNWQIFGLRLTLYLFLILDLNWPLHWYNIIRRVVLLAWMKISLTRRSQVYFSFGSYLYHICVKI